MKPTTKQMMSVGTLALALCAASAFAQQAPVRPGDHPMGQKAGGKMTADKKVNDEHFVMEAAQGGMAEVELGKLAADKAASSEVKKFGQRMADDHGKANDELKTLAQSKNITLPTAIDAKHKATIDRLSKMSGEAFDRAYMQDMLKDHQKDVAAFRTESKTGKDADVKAWASKTLPTLEEHLKLAQDTNRAVGTSGTVAKTPKTTKK
jgi:putative membrane protein